MTICANKKLKRLIKRGMEKVNQEMDSLQILRHIKKLNEKAGQPHDLRIDLDVSSDAYTSRLND